MIFNSLDILNLVLSICIFILTFFLCWAIYYFVESVQRVNRITKRIEQGVGKIEEVVGIARDKLKNSSAYFMILSEIAKKAMEFVQDKREANKESKKNKKK
jgi:methanogenic corrinoid protein MtbC1